MEAPKPGRILLLIGDQANEREEDRDRDTRRLLQEINEGMPELSSVELVTAGVAPAGAKSAEVVTIGALAVSMLPTLAPKLVEFLQAWKLRGQGRTVKVRLQEQDRQVEVEYDPSTMSSAELTQLVENLRVASKS